MAGTLGGARSSAARGLQRLGHHAQRWRLDARPGNGGALLAPQPRARLACQLLLCAALAPAACAADSADLPPAGRQARPMAAAARRLSVADDDPCGRFTHPPNITRAYYINRRDDSTRRRFMERTLAEAGLAAERLVAIEPPAADIARVLSKQRGVAPGSDFMRLLYSQQRCAAKTTRAPPQPPTVCVNPMLLNSLSCPHFSAYGANWTDVLRTRGLTKRLCGFLLANFLSGLAAVRRIHHDLAELRAAEPAPAEGERVRRAPRPDERYVLLLEDDTQVLPDWRRRLCRLLREFPPHTWDLAKVDVDGAERSTPRMQLQRLAALSKPPYTPEQLARLRADPAAWKANTRVDMLRVPHVFGVAALLLRESAVPALLTLMEWSDMLPTDFLVAKWTLRRTIRLAISNEKLFDSITALQLQSSHPMDVDA